MPHDRRLVDIEAMHHSIDSISGAVNRVYEKSARAARDLTCIIHAARDAQISKNGSDFIRHHLTNPQEVSRLIPIHIMSRE
jgi:hypothetical protein